MTAQVMFEELGLTHDVEPVLTFFDVDALKKDWLNAVRGLRIALMTPAYLNEHRGETGHYGPDVLNALEGLGSAWVDKAVSTKLFSVTGGTTTVGRLHDGRTAGRVAFYNAVLDFDWTESAIAGQHANAQVSGKIRRRIINQVIGCLVVAGFRKELESALWPTLDNSVNPDAPSDPRTLLNTFLPAQQQHWLIDKVGPDHQASFTATLVDPQGRRYLGNGPRQKDAEGAASRAYLDQHAADSSKSRGRTHKPAQRTVGRPAAMRLSETQEKGVERLIVELGGDRTWRPLITQALLHQSWVHENRRVVSDANQRDNSALAWLGAYLLDFEYVLSVVSNFLKDGVGKFILVKPSKESHAQALQVIGATDLVMCSRNTTGPKLAAEAFQALAAAVHLNSPTVDVFDNAPEAWAELVDIIRPPSPVELDPTTRLSNAVRSLNLDTSWQTTELGTGIDRTYTSVLGITSALSGASTSVPGPEARSKALSKHLVAAIVLPVIESLSSDDDSLAGLPQLQAFFSAHLELHRAVIPRTELVEETAIPDESTGTTSVTGLGGAVGNEGGHSRKAPQEPRSATVVPLERRNVTEFSTESKSATRTRSRTESQLEERFAEHLRRRNVETGRFRIPTEAGELLTDISDLTNSVLYEAKSSRQQKSVRDAVGQVQWYRHLLKDHDSRPSSVGLLLPGRPVPSMLDFLDSLEIGCTWEVEEGVFETWDGGRVRTYADDDA
ncbi:double-stranded RNA binding motif domain-containing protein [Rhodococcoides fascians]|uniref:double-stranded RNA binding motif domain-containing protein n=1 Tax=Rhodococcoides fascians TaxID=1828 RepID=UPI003672058A